MSVPKHWLLGGWYPWGLIVHQLRHRLSDSNKNVDIKFSAMLVIQSAPKAQTCVMFMYMNIPVQYGCWLSSQHQKLKYV